jgi:hypothetical protein
MLDRVLVSPSWEEHIPLVCVFTLSSDIFDHTPLLIKRGEKDPTLVLIAKVWQENYASKTTHSGSIIASIMQHMHAKS